MASTDLNANIQNVEDGVRHAFKAGTTEKQEESPHCAAVKAENTGDSAAIDLDEGLVVTRRELWAYYLYDSGNNGAGPFEYFVVLFQALARAAGFDATLGPGHPCGDSTPSSVCLLPWGKGTKSVSSTVLTAKGIGFTIMSILFPIIGGAADYGSVNRWLLPTLTVICWATQFASLSLTSPDRWVLAMVLYVAGFVSCAGCLIFYAALFPLLARNTVRARYLREKYDRHELSAEEYEFEQGLERNRISNTSEAVGWIGYIFILVLTLSILIPLSQHPKVNIYTLVLINAYWVITGIWWFIFRQPRPGLSLSKGENYLTIGWKQIWEALRQYKSLPNTFIYLASIFLLTDGLSTNGSLIGICRNDMFHFSSLRITFLNLVEGAAAVPSILVLLYVQKNWRIGTKVMFAITTSLMTLFPLWGTLGIWTTKIGFHNAWEFWVYSVISGLLLGPYSSLCHSLIAELTPPGFENMFFGLYGLSTQLSKVVGPSVIQAIINKTRSHWNGFPFSFAICITAWFIIWYGVDDTKGRRDAVNFSDKKRKKS